MKYRTFRNIFVGGCGTLLVGTIGACVACVASRQDPPPPSPPTVVNNPQQSSGAPVTSSPAAGSPMTASDPLVEGPDGLRPLDNTIVEYLKTHPANTDKVKDAFPRERFKVNIYRDAPDTSWSRLKIDFDRDERDDEKWTLESGQPAKRQVSTKDDGQYDKEFRWLGGKWTPKQP